MKTDKVLGIQEAENLNKRLAEAIHALNELYEASEDFYLILSGENEVSLALELALVRADNVLKGN